MRRDFALPETDRVFLERKFGNWETLNDGSGRWLIIRNQPVPKGYNLETVDIALRIEANYPVAQIDMVYFHPALVRRDGKAIPAICNQSLEGKPWQRWSRHRTPQNPWRPGEDSVETHLDLVTDWLQREFGR